MKSCRVCGNKIEAFMSFGRMPIANGFLSSDEFKSEYYFDMDVAFCKNCCTFQLVNQPEAGLMFHHNYAFFSSQSKHMQLHFQKYSQYVMKEYLMDQNDPFVVELGSNDGIMLRNFKDAGYRHLGIEPSENVADVARSEGIKTISKFFDEHLAEKIIEEYGHANAVVAANVMCHIPHLDSVGAGISKLLKHDGVLIFEDPYLGDMISKTSYDQIYDEHVYIFSAASVSWIFGKHGLELIDVMPQSTHGGSMRYIFAKKGVRPVSKTVSELLKRERDQGLHVPETYQKFKENCEKSRSELVELLEKLRVEGKRVVGYGATSKSTTVLNYCGIGPTQIEFICDTTPIKQNKFSPGMHIPIKAYDDFAAAPPEYALLFAWNHSKEIFEKEHSYTSKGGSWITYVPEVRVFK